MKKVFLMSLGCSRNLVDSEVLEGVLKKSGFLSVDSPEKSDIAIVNTCGFIRDAKDESINAVLQLAELKKRGKIKNLIVMGCLSQRYPSEIFSKITEIDAVFGTSDLKKIPGYLARMSGKRVLSVSKAPGFILTHKDKRVYRTPKHYVYLKIQEGCSNRCSYCVIPSIRGPLRSRPVTSVLKEAGNIMSDKNVKEIVVIGQDIGAYGIDKGKNNALAGLVRELDGIVKGEKWIRLLYMHPANITGELMNAIASSNSVLRYVDVPVQHINDRILGKMDRRVGSRDIRKLLTELRERLPGVILRTSVIVGFPGETEKEFSELIDFLEAARFDRLGAFMYSREEGTKAFGYGAQVTSKKKKERFDKVMTLQQKISRENNMGLIGRTLRVIVDEKEGNDYAGRSYMDAPEVDGGVYIRSRKALRTGDFVDVKVTGATEYDLDGEAA
jgi:ribosomal protein S12 methylthiotransferase